MLANIFMRYPRYTIGLCALIVRIIPAYIFYGSCDIDAFAEIIGCILHDGPISYGIKNWNMLPSISFYLWFAGFLAAKTNMLLALCIKFIPIFCDVALALLLYEMVLHRSAKHAFGVGFLYALCPVSIVVNTIHGQWESVFLLPLILSFYIRDYGEASYTTSIIFGVVFGLSILIKPIGLLFVPFFLRPREGVLQYLGLWWRVLKIIGIFGCLGAFSAFFLLALSKHSLMDVGNFFIHYHTSLGAFVVAALSVMLIVGWGIGKKIVTAPVSVRHYVALQMIALVSFMAVIGGAFLIFICFHFNILGLLDACLRYANKGPQGFGLRLIVSSLCPLLGFFLENRMILLGWVAVCTVMYYRRHIDVFDAMVMVFAGISGLCPHYLIWLIPCAFFKGFYRSVGLYGFCATMLYAIYYNPPQLCDWAFLFRLSFAPLSSYAWLASPAYLVTHDSAVLLLGLLGNVLIPLSCWLMLWSLLTKSMVRDDTRAKTNQRIPAWWFVVGIVSFSVVILGCMLTTDATSLAETFDGIARHRYIPYSVVSNDAHLVLRSMDVVRTYASLWCNAINLLVLWGCAWFIGMVWFGKNIQQRSEM